jgi:hypothetical protein
MARSQRKTTVAILREVLGPNGKLDFFSQLIGKSQSWVRHISSGVLPLTRRAAFRIALATGVSVEWLLRGDVSSPPETADRGRPFDLAAFENHRQKLRSDFPSGTEPLDIAKSIEVMLLTVSHLSMPRGFLGNFFALVHDSMPIIIDRLTEVGSTEIPRSLVKILAAIHASGRDPTLLNGMLQDLEKFADHLEKKSGNPKDRAKASTARESNFIRLVLRSTQAQLKLSKIPQKTVSK